MPNAMVLEALRYFMINIPLPKVNRNPSLYVERIAGREMRASLPGLSCRQFVGRARLENMLGRAPFGVG